MNHVLVVGAGIAGVPAAYMMKNRLGTQGQVTVISDMDYFQFVPSNPWVAMGWRDRSEIAFPVGPCLAEHGIEFIPFAAKFIDGARNLVELEDGRKISYNYLILAAGSEPAYDEIAGSDPSAGYVHSVMRVDDAVEAHEAYKRFVRNPGPVIVGAAPGSSIIGPVYELAFLIDSDLRRRNIRNRTSITVFTPEPYVGHLGIGAEGEGRQLLENALTACNIEYLTNVRTKKIDSGLIHITECDALGNDLRLRKMPFSFGVYWAAFRGVSALRNSPGLTDERGFVMTDEFLRSTAFPNIFAVGVCRAHAPITMTPLGIGAPSSVYSIQNEVDISVRNIASDINGQAPTSLVPRHAVWLSDAGKQGAEHHSQPQIPLRNINWLQDGRWVHRAKVDFENYFINKIKLRPAAGMSIADSHIATLMRKLQSRSAQRIAAYDDATAAMRHLDVPVSADLDYDLRALCKNLRSG